MKLRRRQSQLNNWEIFFPAFLISFGILHNSDVFAAVVSVSFPWSTQSSSMISPRSGNAAAAFSEARIRSRSSDEDDDDDDVDDDDIADDINHSSLEDGIPTKILGEVMSLDHRLKCFPKLMCTIYHDNSITRHGALNNTELGLAYIQLLKAVYYTPLPTTTRAPSKKQKRPLVQIFQIPAGLIKSSAYYGGTGRKDQTRRRLGELDDYRYHFRRSPIDDRRLGLILQRDNDNDDDGRGAFFREKIAMSQMIKDLNDEDRDEIEQPMTPFYLPFGGLASYTKHRRSRAVRRRSNSPRISKSKKSQEPFEEAVKMWKKLKRRSQCQTLYKSCPFEAWEIMKMLDLVKGLSKRNKVVARNLKGYQNEAKQTRRRN